MKSNKKQIHTHTKTNNDKKRRITPKQQQTSPPPCVNMLSVPLENSDAECSLSVHQREPTDVSAKTLTHFFQRGAQTSAKEVAKTTQGDNTRKEKQHARKCKQMRTRGKHVQTNGGGEGNTETQEKQTNKQTTRKQTRANNENNK